MMKLIRSWGYLARCVHNSGRTRPSPARLLCGEGCCLPGFCPGQICIHLMDCWGRGSPPWEAVECLLRAVEKGCPVFAQALEMPGAFRGARSIRGTLRSLGHRSREPFSRRTSFQDAETEAAPSEDPPGATCLFYQPWWPLEFAKVIWSGPFCSSPAWALLSPCPSLSLLPG